MLSRMKMVLSNEEASLTLEQMVLISILILVGSCLLLLDFKMHEMSEVKSGYSTSTGWFRTDNLQGIKD